MTTALSIRRLVLGTVGLGGLFAYASCVDYAPTSVWDPATPMTVEITKAEPSEVHYLGQQISVQLRTTPNWAGATTQISKRTRQIQQDSAGSYRALSFDLPIDSLQIEFVDDPARFAKTQVKFRQITMRVIFCYPPVEAAPMTSVPLCAIPVDSGGHDIGVWQLNRDPIQFISRDTSVVTIEENSYVPLFSVNARHPGVTYIVLQSPYRADSLRFVVKPTALASSHEGSGVRLNR